MYQKIRLIISRTEDIGYRQKIGHNRPQNLLLFLFL